MTAITEIVGHGIPLVLDDIDTDRIIPARYLRCVTFEGLGNYAFEDDRKQDPEHPFDDPRFAGATILVAGRNFGCGSSREHAPQALMRWGIKAIVGESFAEIFFGNCTSLGIPAVCAERSDIENLAALIEEDCETTVRLDLKEMAITAGDLRVICTLPDSARNALVSGEYDFLSQLLEGESQIYKTATSLPYMSNFA